VTRLEHSCYRHSLGFNTRGALNLPAASREIFIGQVLGKAAGEFVTSRGYGGAKSRPVSNRAIVDQVLGDELERLHAANYGV